MLLAPRKIAFVVLAGLAITTVGCSGNKDKIVGKWKMVSMTGKDGKEQKMDMFGITPIMEFTADGNIKVGVDAGSLPAEFKEKMANNKEAAAKMNETKQIGKYKVSGDTIEFVDMEKSGDSPFGKSNKAALKFEGDNATISGDDGTLKISRMK